MSKITLSAVLTIIRIVLTLGEKIVRSLYTVLDICDDGVINDSIQRPEWYDVVVRTINNLELALKDVGSVSDQMRDGILKENTQ